MKTVLFELHMVGVPSWNGKWTGAGNRYLRAFSMTNEKYAKLCGVCGDGSCIDGRAFSYRWPDNWAAEVLTSVVSAAEAQKQMQSSIGFAGYDWMISSIFEYGRIKV